MADRTQVASYFEQSGALMCLVSLLGAHDLHMENVVATSAGPVLVDIEMLLQPVRRDAGSPDDTGDPADQTPETSVLDTGLLSMIDVSAEGEAVDAGGLRGQSRGPLPFPARVWHGLGTDALHYVEEPNYAAAGRHEVRLAGVRQDPGQYADALLAGFTRAYRSLLTRRAELLASDGPLHAFAGSVVRVVQRPTNQYAMLRVVLSAPRYQRNGVAASTAVDVLHRGWSGAVARPTGWEIAIAERRALDRLDVPLFSARADGLDLQCEGRTIGPRFFAQSGLAAAIARAEGLSERDLHAQAARLARALGESVASRYAGSAPEALRLGSGQGGPPKTRVVAVARWIGHALLACAETTNGRSTGGSKPEPPYEHLAGRPIGSTTGRSGRRCSSPRWRPSSTMTRGAPRRWRRWRRSSARSETRPLTPPTSAAPMDSDRLSTDSPSRPASSAIVGGWNWRRRRPRDRTANRRRGVAGRG